MSLSAALRRLLRTRSAADVAREALRTIAGGRVGQLPVGIRFWDGSVLAPDDSGRGAPADPLRRGATPVPTVVVRSPRALAHVLHEPSELGLSRAYVDGSLTAEGELEPLLSLRAPMQEISLTSGDRARLALAALRAGGLRVLRRPPVPAIEAHVSGDRHSMRRDRQAISHHYDVSNAFYRLVLGPSLVYSCAYFSDPSDTLEEAQERKLDVICRKLDLHPDERLLDIGCGWGSLVLHAAEHYGVRATGVTLSGPQAALARERAAQRGLADRIEIRVADYRTLAGRQFDKIASVGMYEHVGRAELAGYVTTVHDLLTPGGLLLNHGIAQLRVHAPNPNSFISRYIFPDGELHPLADLVTTLAPAGLEVRDVESLREHYTLTLYRWRDNLRAELDRARELVGAERVRTWELYMTGSARAFEVGEISVYQTLAVREDGPHTLPLDRLALLAPRAVSACT